MSNLAYECLKESPRKVSPELEAEIQLLESGVQNLRYQKLEEYLQNEQWKEANEETNRLMIQAAGKEEGQWLWSEDLENVSCDDLQIINQLWLSNSQDKFGFSTQKKIYESLGGTMDYDYATLKAFYESIDWKKGTKWLSYSDLTYSINAIEGHLPTTPNFSFNYHPVIHRRPLTDERGYYPHERGYTTHKIGYDFRGKSSAKNHSERDVLGFFSLVKRFVTCNI